ncbi:calcium-dependent protein kinase 1-like [Montipora capricornis]|uniref:calcium-dependent protein kinase 1-like n=1 Tax=Montipora capricornis TaxID=246305 RepID=UPI0035F13EE4
MKSVVKEMKRRNQSYKETERCKREVLHEATVINSLGDHPNLSFLFGVCTEKEPFSLVLQFYGKGGKSLTLHMVVKARMLKKKSTTKVFQEIINTLEYIHDKGYVHNDLKANNVILDWRGDEFRPILIDFGKSEQISKVEGYKRRTSSYIAPEVILGEKEGPRSDIYSFGKMLEAAVSGRSFCASFKEVISETTALAASDRPSTRKVSLLFSEV